MNLCKRFEIHQQLGEGSFSKIYHAYDKKLKMEVALKVEKEDKHKKILKFEYEILKNLQGLIHAPKLFDFIENTNKSVIFVSGSENQSNTNDACNAHNLQIKNEKEVNENPTVGSEGLNFIVMELLGKNVANFKKSKHSFDNLDAYDILLQMLDAIEQLHDRGYIHRDIKPTNFVVKENIKKSNKNKLGLVQIYMVDYGLAKIHLDKFCRPFPPRRNTDFRGTLTYASLNAHYKKELARRDDLWSFFFVILDLLNENLPWRTCKDDKDDIKKFKEICLADPEKKLLLTTTKGKKEILDILNHIKSLNYADRPNYKLIKIKLNELRMYEINKLTRMNLSSGNFKDLGDNDNHNNIFNNSNFNNDLNNFSHLNNMGVSNLKNVNTVNNFSNINKNFGFYDFNNKQIEVDSSTKEEFFANNLFLNSPINKNLSNNFNDNMVRTTSNFLNNGNYFSADNLQSQLNYMADNNTNTNFGKNVLNNCGDTNGLNINPMNNFSNKNHLNYSDNYNFTNYLARTQNYVDLIKKLYLENLFQLGLPVNSLIGLENSNTNNFYNIINTMNMNFGGLQNNFINNVGSLKTNLNNYNSNINNMNSINNLNMGGLNNLNNLTNLPEMNDYSNFQLPTGTIFKNQLHRNPCVFQNFFTNNIEEKNKESLNTTNNNSAINKKRKRSLNTTSVGEENKNRNFMSSQQQNQIFIINQFNKNQPTELENKLVNFLMKQSLNNEINSNPTTYKTKEKDNDKILINSIIQKLKPSDKKSDNNLIKNDTVIKNKDDILISNIDDIYNNVRSVEIDQLSKSVLVKSSDSSDFIDDNNVSITKINLFNPNNSISKNRELIKSRNNNTQIFKIEKKVNK